MRLYSPILSMVNLRKIKQNIRARCGEFLAANGNLKNKGCNIRAVRKTTLFRADLLGLGNRIFTNKKTDY
jgi:hypothetical protein